MARRKLNPEPAKTSPVHRLGVPRIAGVAAVLLLTALPSLTGCDGPRPAHEGADRPAVTAQTRIAALEAIPVHIEATGTVEPWVRVSPGTKILGRIGRVRFREGDRVRAGQVLVELEKRDLEAAAAQSRAAVRMAEAHLENAGAQFERIRVLRERGSVTEKNLEDATAAYRVAEAQREQAGANLAAAEVTLGYAEIRTPVSGFVTEKRVEAGDMASPGAPLFTVEDLSRVKVVVQVPESDVVGLDQGAPARLRIDVLEQTHDATVDRVVPAGDPTSRTYRVQLVLDNPEGRIKSGMFARAWFERGSREALLVPESAVLDRGQLRGVFVVGDDDIARLRWVRTGRLLEDGIEVLSGLAAGERFVVSPPPALTDGSPIVTR